MKIGFGGFSKYSPSINQSKIAVLMNQQLLVKRTIIQTLMN